MVVKLLATLFIVFLSINSNQLKDNEKLIFRICHGCCLKHQKEIQAFVYKDIPKYESKLKLEYMPNHKATFIVRDDQKVEHQTINAENMSRIELREVVESFGIKPVKELKELPGTVATKVREEPDPYIQETEL